MKPLFKLLLVICLTVLACKEKQKENNGFTYQEKSTETAKTQNKSTDNVPPSKQIHLNNKGIGPISSITLQHTINQTMATHGKERFKKLCAACHKTDKKFIGPAPKDILKRRSPEWVMNILLNPIEMIEKDTLAKALFNEFDGTIMPKQDLTETDARAILEYFRTL